jgi:hypothetical protein
MTCPRTGATGKSAIEGDLNLRDRSQVAVEISPDYTRGRVAVDFLDRSRQVTLMSLALPPSQARLLANTLLKNADRIEKSRVPPMVPV